MEVCYENNNVQIEAGVSGRVFSCFVGVSGKITKIVDNSVPRAFKGPNIFYKLMSACKQLQDSKKIIQPARVFYTNSDSNSSFVRILQKTIRL